MIQAILAALQAIPALVDAIKLVSKAIGEANEQRLQASIDHYIEQGRAIERDLTGAKTDEERQAILRRLVDLRSSRP